MCNFASFVATKDKVYWVQFTNSHEDIIRKYNLAESDLRFRAPSFVRIELLPNKECPDNIDEWCLVIDQDMIPEWTYSGDPELRKRAIEAAKERAKVERWFQTVDDSGGLAVSGYGGRSYATGYRGIAVTHGDGVATTDKRGISAVNGEGGTASSGDYGTSVSQVRGTSRAEYRGNAISGPCGKAISGTGGVSVSKMGGVSVTGEYGMAVSGDSGRSEAGVLGVAVAGSGGISAACCKGISIVYEDGTASAGEGGILLFRAMPQTGKNAPWVVAVVGKKGIKPDTLYKLGENNKPEEVSKIEEEE